MVPFTAFLMNAEGNFKKAEVKKIAERRRKKLDKEHGVDRQLLQDSFLSIDKEYRISEKDEIKKYLELGKTPQQYFQDQLAVVDDDDKQQNLE